MAGRKLDRARQTQHLCSRERRVNDVRLDGPADGVKQVLDLAGVLADGVQRALFIPVVGWRTKGSGANAIAAGSSQLRHCCSDWLCRSPEVRRSGGEGDSEAREMAVWLTGTKTAIGRSGVWKRDVSRAQGWISRPGILVGQGSVHWASREVGMEVCRLDGNDDGMMPGISSQKKQTNRNGAQDTRRA